MTPEEKFNQQVWEILQRIKEEIFATETGKPVKYRISSIVGIGIIPPDRRIKILYKLQEWKAFEIQRNARGVRIGTGDIFYLIINQSKFNELYHIYESGGSYQENKKEKPTLVTSKNQPVIKSKTLELIAQDIGNLDTGTNLINFLTNCGVDKNLIEYPQTKWRMVNTVLQTLATSKNPKDFRVLYKIIEEACHPLTHEGNEVKAKEITNKFNNLLKYDDIYLEDGILFRKSENYDDAWISSDGKVIEPEAYLVIPQDVAKLYVFWNELIRITKFYLSNPDKQSDELNEIYLVTIP